jgi:glycosyltransferase involved in cell wall biosynthesis
MRIFFVLSRIPYPLTDGGAIVSYNTLKYLRQAGHEIAAAALNPKKHRETLEPLAAMCSRARAFDIDTDITPRGALAALARKESYVASRFVSAEFLQILMEEIRAFAPDIVHLDHTLVGWYAGALRRALPPAERPPIVLRAHNVEYVIQRRLATGERFLARRWYREIEAERLRETERQYFRECDGVAAITSEDAAEIRQMGFAGEIACVPAGVDTEEFAPATQAESAQTLPNTACYIGGMDWEPNIEAMRWFVGEILPKALRLSPTMEFHIAGKRMSDEIRAYERVRGVRVFPNAPSAADFLRAREILVVPLRSGGGMRLKIIEAMALGKAIISTRVGAEGIAVRDGESILFAETPEEFAGAIAHLLENPALRRRLGEAARKLALERYRWESVTLELTKLYERLLSLPR